MLTVVRMSGKKREVRVRRIYDGPEEGGGARVLVDRMWPRGVSKERAVFDEWLKAVAPSNELRRWYHHDPEHYGEFGERYRAELAEGEQADALERLRKRAASGPLTLLTSTRDVDHSHAAVLADILRERR